EFRALDEGGNVAADDLHVDARVLHVDDLAGDDRTFLELGAALIGRGTRAAAGKLLDTERNALFLDVDVEHLRLHHVALLVFLDHLLARTAPIEVGKMDHAVDVAVEAEEETELGLILDFAFHGGARRMLLGKSFPRVGQRLLEAERNPALHRIDLDHRNFDFLRGGDELARMDVLFRPGHFGDVDEAFDARFEFDEGAVVGDVGDAALHFGADRILRFDAFPRIALQLLHAEGDAVRLVIDLDDLNLHRLPNGEHVGRVIDAPPRNVGDVQKAVDAAEID